MNDKQETAKVKRDAQAAGIKYGCHLELDEGMEPDGCVKDYGDNLGCVYATRHKTREGCKYWLRVAEKDSAS
jgi:hypothetical protein